MKRQKEPIKNSISKTPSIIQLEMLECGAACLTMVMANYGKWVPLEKVRYDCGVSRDGSNAKNIVLAARSYGFDVEAYQYSIDSLKKKATYPCILFWDFNHFVVLKGFKDNIAYINDPAKGPVKITAEDFDRSYTGICLLFKPNESFKPGGKRPTVVSYIFDKIKSNLSIFIFLTIFACLTAICGLIQPTFDRFFVDVLLAQQAKYMLAGFVTVFFIFTFIKIIYEWFNVVYKNRIGAKFSVSETSNFLWKLLNLPLEFFSQRNSGDLLSRKESSTSITNNIMGIFAPLFLNIIQIILYLFIMFRYNCYLTLIGVIGIFLNFIIAGVLNKHLYNYSRRLSRDQSMLYGVTLNNINMIETIKAAGAEHDQFNLWTGCQTEVNNDIVFINKLSAYYNAIPKAVNGLIGVAITGLGVYFIINGEFTAGMLMAFTGFLQAFTQPANFFISVGKNIQTMKADIERVDDVLKYEEDKYSYSKGTSLKLDKYEKLSGEIELKNITFAYSRFGNNVISDFNMSLKKGKSVAIVGSSGCGKSTISKILCGLYLPKNGEVLFDGKKISEIDRGVFKSSVALVDQDVVLFEDTIKNNITMWDKTISDEDIVNAAKDAQIHSEIMEQPDAYQEIVCEDGVNFSGGQRQRIEIARVLTLNPTLIILDEATSALDAVTEYKAVEAIRKRGITSVVIAHRLSTIRNCDEIIVLENGEIVERGTHDQLMELGKYYKKLVINE